MNILLLSVHHAPGKSGWTFAAARGPWPRYPGETYQSISEATAAAIAWSQQHSIEVEITGHPDRSLLRAAGVRFVDSRGNRHRGSGAQRRQRAIMDARMAARRAAKEGPCN